MSGESLTVYPNTENIYYDHADAGKGYVDIPGGTQCDNRFQSPLYMFDDKRVKGKQDHIDPFLEKDNAIEFGVVVRGKRVYYCCNDQEQ